MSQFANLKRFSSLVDAGSTTATGTLLTFTMPAGGKLDGAFMEPTAGPTIELQIVRAAATHTITSVSASTLFSTPVVLLEGDIIRWEITAGVSGTADAGLFGEHQDKP